MKLERSDFSSLLAVLISLGALGVSLYEANLMQKQQLILQEQQKATVWPYLESENFFVFTPEKIELSFSVVNKGVGPARASKAKMTVAGEVVTTYSGVVETVLATLKALNPNLETSDLSINFGEVGGILSPLEEYEYLKISVPGLTRFPEGVSLATKLDVAYSVCYCSIYDDCWTLEAGAERIVENCVVE